MSSPVHLTAVPDSEEGLRRAIGKAHRRYTRHINFRENKGIRDIVARVAKHSTGRE